MTAHEVYRYLDSRGDTIIYKFDPELLNDPVESPISIFHEWRQDFHKTIQWSSMLLDTESAIERYKKDKKPSPGFLLHEEKNAEGRRVVYRFVPFKENRRGYVVNFEGR